jgi:HEPN domain-containing protein
LVKTKIVEQWLSKANDDLRFAKAALQLEEKFYAQIVFHCQQSVEKALKGFLSYNKIPFPKTHDIRELLNHIGKTDGELVHLLDKTEILSKFAVSIRYPASHGEEVIITKVIADDCILLASSALVEISARIK